MRLRRLGTVETSIALAALFVVQVDAEPARKSEEFCSRTLYVTLDANDAGIQLTTRVPGGPPIAAPRTDKRIQERFRRMYEILERQLPQGDELEEINRDLSATLIGPIEAALDSCGEVVVVLQGQSLEIPFDLLLYRGEPLFLRRPVSYRLGETVNTEFVLEDQWSAFVVSDVTADPERACYAVAEVLDAVAYYDVHEISAASLRREGPRDVVVLSVHGIVGNSDVDHVMLGEGTVLPSDFSSVRPRLVYFDSCRLGVSQAFLDRFRQFGTCYYIAPILSNEAGESSTHTLRGFFEQLNHGKRPEEAMFITRQNLAKRYEGESVVRRLWRAFPFRVYRLN